MSRNAILVELNSSAMRARTGSGDREHHGNHGIKAAGKRTEEALKEVGESVNEVFKDMKEQFSKFTRPSWFGGSSKETPAQLAKPVAGGQEAHAHNAHAHDPHPEDDTTMRHHCAALERLVEMGLSPQAAKVAVRRLDSWLVSEDGRAEMAAAEAEAFSAGEPILHVHDQVRLEGLIKNKGTNGALGILQAYGAESHRWKVTLHDGQVFWIKPKLLRPLQLRRMPLPDPSPPEDTTHTEEVASKTLAAAWAKLEARQHAWKEEQEAREIRLLEKEEELRKMQEALEEEEVHLMDRRRSFGNEAQEPQKFHMEEPTHPELSRGPAVVSHVADESSVMPLPHDHEEEDAEADEMWDMDWSAVAGQSSGGPANAPFHPPHRGEQGMAQPGDED